MKLVFDIDSFIFPYEGIKFPGQANDERILYVAREAEVMMYIRLLGLLIVVVSLLGLSIVIPGFLPGLESSQQMLVTLGGCLLAGVFLVVGGWWIYNLWKKSLFVVTTRRLAKFIYTTPWNRYNLSINLDKIIDTGAYAKGYLEAYFGIGTFTARSGAGNRAEKYFYVENVHMPEDLANYVNKVLFAYNSHQEKLPSFRPFLPWLKGEARKRFMKDYPQFWS